MKPGEWKSDLHASDVAKAGVTAGWPSIVGDDVWWAETRPEEDGRTVIVSEKLGDLTTDPFSARHMVHEYSGRSYLGLATQNGYVLYFINKSDQRLYRKVEGSEPVALTPESDREYRYAEMVRVGNEIWCVREHVTHTSCTRDLVAISDEGKLRVLTSGHQFYAHPRVSPDGKHISWISWEHPRMPWDGTELFIADIEDGELRNKRAIAGSESNPVLSPEWRNNSSLVYIDESNGWWNPWTVDIDGSKSPIISEQSEWGFPAWQLGYVGVGLVDGDTFIGIHGPVDNRKLALVDITTGSFTDFDSEFTFFDETFATSGQRVLCFAANNSSFSTLVEFDAQTLKAVRVVRPNPFPISVAYAPEISEVRIPGNGREVKVILHRAKNPHYDHQGPTPVLVQIHGGPTANCFAIPQLGYLYWTSRGFTVADVNYGGSTGYGSEYRHLLDGRWGIIDYEDVITTVNYLKANGIADESKVFISGGSAGGFTVLNALVHSNVFAAGADYFGVADLGALATDTHDFESRYLDSMIGPYPQLKAIYDERSPLTHSEKLETPLIIFQGTEDKVVPPAQSEAFRDVCLRKGIKHKYFAYEGEGHGFAKASSIITSLEESLIFFGESGDFTPKL